MCALVVSWDSLCSTFCDTEQMLPISSQHSAEFPIVCMIWYDWIQSSAMFKQQDVRWYGFHVCAENKDKIWWTFIHCGGTINLERSTRFGHDRWFNRNFQIQIENILVSIIIWHLICKAPLFSILLCVRRYISCQYNNNNKYFSAFITLFLQSWTAFCYKALCASIHPFICMSIMKCHREQKTEPKSANFGKHIHAEKVSSSANFHPNHRPPWPSFSRSKIRIEYIRKFIRDYLANHDKYGVHCYCQQIKVAYGFSIGIFTFDRGPF